MTRTCALSLACIAFLAGCDFNVYELDLDPRGDEIARTLTVWRAGSSEDPEAATRDFPTDELSAIALAYSSPMPPGGSRKHTFCAVFRDRMPADIGGSGVFRHFASDLGETWLYVERFRGNDRPSQTVEEIFAATDRLTELLSDWLGEELAPSPETPRLRAFLEGDFRRDLKDLAMHAWLASNATKIPWLGQSAEAPRELLARVSLLLLDRGYLLADDIPIIRRCLTLPEKQQRASLTSLLIGRLLARSGIQKNTDAGRRIMELAEAPARLEESIGACVARSPEYVELVREWTERGGQESEKPRPSPIDVLSHLAGAMLPLHLDPLSGDRLGVVLHCGDGAVYTNGDRHGEGAEIRWTSTLPPRGEKTPLLPAACFAIWARPNADAQKRTLGGIVLDGESLVDYCLWRAGLTPEEAARWGRLLESLPADEARIARLQELGEEEPSPGAPLGPVLRKGASILLNSLETRQETGEGAPATK
jgi:hypothetical protein